MRDIRNSQLRNIALIASSLALVPSWMAACSGSSTSPDLTAAAGGSDATGSGGAGGSFASGGSSNTGGSIIGTGGTGVPTDGGNSWDAPSFDAPDSCGQSALQATSKIVNILLVIDKSGSMTSTPAGFGTDKWTAMKMALSGALAQVQGGISFGLELFPNNVTTPIPTSCTSNCWDMPPGSDAVVVPVGPGSTTTPLILGKLDTMPAGGTPTAVALQLAHAYYMTGPGRMLTGEKYVLLATDGGPNGNGALSCDSASCTVNMDRGQSDAGVTNYCSAMLVPDGPKSCLDDKETIDELSTMAASGIKTFVIGIPGTDPYVSTLDAMAVAGAAPASTTSPKYFAVSAAGGVAGLQQVFESITKQLIKSCSLQLQSAPPDLGLLNVYVDGKVIPKPGADGWDLDLGTTPPTVVLKGATCANIQANGASTMQVRYGCPTVIVK